MKRKKEWSKGRTIIAYANTCGLRWKAPQSCSFSLAANAQSKLAQPLRQRQHPGTLDGDSPLHPERRLHFLNHDLVGFFNSIPQSDIIRVSTS